MVNLIATDLDGTFLSGHAEYSATNAEALQAAREAGVEVIFATGRSSFWLDFLRPLAPQPRYAIASNGAAVLDLATGTFSHETALPGEVALGIVDDLRRAFPGVRFGAERGHDLLREPAYAVRFHYPAVPDLEAELAAGHVFKLIAQLDGVDVATWCAQASDVIGTRATATFSWVGDPAHLEISSRGVSKASALAQLATERGIDAADVACFGDMPNDAAMLTWCGHPHVMPASHPTLLEAGFPVLEGPQESAVGRRILELLGR